MDYNKTCDFCENLDGKVILCKNKPSCFFVGKNLCFEHYNLMMINEIKSKIMNLAYHFAKEDNLTLNFRSNEEIEEKIKDIDNYAERIIARHRLCCFEFDLFSLNDFLTFINFETREQRIDFIEKIKEKKNEPQRIC